MIEAIRGTRRTFQDAWPSVFGKINGAFALHWLENTSAVVTIWTKAASTCFCRIVQFYNGIQYSEIFTLAVYVVRRFEGPNATEQRIGQLAGLLVSNKPISIFTDDALVSGTKKIFGGS